MRRAVTSTLLALALVAGLAVIASAGAAVTGAASVRSRHPPEAGASKRCRRASGRAGTRTRTWSLRLAPAPDDLALAQIRFPHAGRRAVARDLLHIAMRAPFGADYLAVATPSIGLSTGGAQVLVLLVNRPSALEDPVSVELRLSTEGATRRASSAPRGESLRGDSGADRAGALRPRHARARTAGRRPRPVAIRRCGARRVQRRRGGRAGLRRGLRAALRSRLQAGRHRRPRRSRSRRRHSRPRRRRSRPLRHRRPRRPSANSRRRLRARSWLRVSGGGSRAAHRPPLGSDRRAPPRTSRLELATRGHSSSPPTGDLPATGDCQHQ